MNPEVLVAHHKALDIAPIIYPFWKSMFRSMTLPTGIQTFNWGEILTGVVPAQLLVVFVDSTAYARVYNKNPFNFQNFSLNYLEFSVNNQSVPSVPYKPDFSTNHYTKEFLSMFMHEYPRQGGNFISLEDFGKGYAIYCFNLDRQANKQVMCEPARRC
jgi:hypothetical protein